jgi:oligopeptide transport system substrate-binding protein
LRIFLYLLLLSLAGCSPKSPKPLKQELHMNMKSEPLSLDPRKPADVASNNFLKMCFDGLVRMDLEGKPVLSVAKSVDISSDQKKYTITLKETFWSDGTPVTSYDFIYSWKTQLDPLFPSENCYLLYVLKNAQAAKEGKCALDAVGAVALDATRLELDLTYPNPLFLTMLSSYCFFPVPSHIVKQHPNWADKATPLYVTNGPFHLKEWHPSDKMLLEKNRRYWDAENVKLEALHFVILEDENTELSLYDVGELDWIGSPLSALPNDALPSLKDVCIYPVAGTYYYVFNTKDSLFQNVNLRRALSLAVNRKNIVDNILHAGQTPALRFIPQALCKDERAYFRDGDSEQARVYLKRALDELGLKELPVLTLSYNTLQSHHLIAQAIQQQWQRALGVRIKLENKEWKVYLDERKRGQFQIMRMGSIANDYDPLHYLDHMRYLSSAENFSKWTNPQYTEYLEEAEKESDLNKRMGWILKAEALFIDEMPVIPLFFYAGSYLKKNYVQNVSISQLLDIDFKWAYIE